MNRIKVSFNRIFFYYFLISLCIISFLPSNIEKYNRLKPNFFKINDVFILNDPSVMNELKTENYLLYNFWEKVLKLPLHEIKKVLDYVYPYDKLKDFQQFGFLADANLLSNINSESLTKMNNTLFYKTEEVQKIINDNQNPQNCSDRNFIFVDEVISGIGSTIHILTTYLAHAIENNQTLIFLDQFFSYRERFATSFQKL